MTGVLKRSLSLQGHRTSISLENEFWDALRAIATKRKISIAELVSEVDKARKSVNLSSALRVFVLQQMTQNTGHFGAEIEPVPEPGTDRN